MNKCSDHKNSLLLDVYGELDPQERIIWEKHLTECAACQNARKRLMGLVQAAQKGKHSSVLSSKETQALSSSILRKLRAEKSDNMLAGRNWQFVPAVAIACILVLFLGWFSLKDFKSSDKVAINSSSVPEEQIMVNNKDLIENMELLLEMEILEKLVSLLDDHQNGPKLNKRESKANYVRARV